MKSTRSVGRLVMAFLLCAGGLGCPGTIQARFDASPKTGEAPLTVRFQDRSQNGGVPIASWEWDFGDGITSGAQNPIHLYAAPGTYDVTLTVTNADGQSTVVKTDHIQAAPVTLEEGDRVGMLLVSADSRGVAGTVGEAVGSAAYFLPGTLDQISLVGMLGTRATETTELDAPCIDFVEAMAPDSTVVVDLMYLESWLAGEYGAKTLSGTRAIAGLDAGATGSITASGKTEALIPWSEHPDCPYEPADPMPAFASGTYIQEHLIQWPTRPQSVSLSWPGGADLGPFSASVSLPARPVFLSPVDFGPGDPTGIETPMSKLDTTKSLVLTWQASAGSTDYIQIVLSVNASTYLLAKAVDDGSFTVPAAVMAELPAEDSKAYYQQVLVLSRLRSSDRSVPLTEGGLGRLRVVALTGSFIGVYSNR